jgi:two-component sensor histidine kinase
VTWRTERDGTALPSGIEIDWIEKGGPPVVEPEAAGFGSRLLRVTAAELGGTTRTEFRPEGLVWHLRFPLPDPHRQPEAETAAAPAPTPAC